MVGWALGVIAMGGFTVGLWPALPDPTDLQQLLQSVPEGLLALFGAAGDVFLSPAGYLDGRLFALLAPLVLVLFAVGAVTAATAGEEAAGRLDLLLSTPVSRRRVVLEKAGAVALLVLVLAALLFTTLVAGAVVVGLDVGVTQVAAACLSLVLLTWSLAALALAIACATGRRGLSLGATAAVAVAGYLVDSFAPLVDWLATVRPASPFYLYRGNQPLVNGLDPLHAGPLAVATLLLMAVAVWNFDRRDIGT